MLATAAITLLALVASLALGAAGVGEPVAVLHVAFAIGIVPLVFAAMGHFVPVLTRSGDPPPAIRGLPFAAQVSGAVAVLAMQGMVPRGALHAAALADLALAVALAGWIIGRARRALGTPHPGWRWYAAGLACLGLALAGILAQAVVPAHWVALRNFHLHLNTLGFVGFAAVGTLPVLLPTAVGTPDPEAAGWLRRRLWPVAAALAAIAGGAAALWSVAIVGAAVLLVIVLGLVAQWLRRYGLRRMLADGSAAALLAATAGLALMLAAGAAHGAGLLPARPTLAAWFAGFLLPLVTGALSHLLPVWRWPGPATPSRLAMRARLTAHGGARAALFLAAAAAFLAGHPVPGAALAAAGLVLFVAALVAAMRALPRSTG
ncbi:MAG: hypothetical protein FIB06_05235 [Betaproteobacteria bacterium]|nr:hypothetical protein [Betaproteobacteria bacterium]